MEKTKIESKEKEVEEKKQIPVVVTPHEEKKVEVVSTPVVPTVTIPQKPKRKRNTIKLVFWLIVIAILGVIFTYFGMFLSNTAIPYAKDWLIDHNFMESTVKDKESNSPFLPQPTDVTGAKGSDSLTIPQVVKKTSASVVSIAVSSADINGDVTSTDNIGTGFIIDSAGIIITNQHVVSDTTKTYEVVTQDKKTYKTTKIIRDTVNDIALLVIDAKNLTAISLGDSDKIEVGETVIAIGTPLGAYPGSVTVGVISGIGRSVKTGGTSFWEVAKEYNNVIQTDTAVNPGNSGGPLINLLGQVIGVNFATTSGADNISFALPINLVKQKVEEYKQFGKFRSAYLGVGYRMVTADEATYYSIEKGALVRSVTAGSPAEKAKLQIGDIITKVNSKVVEDTLANVLSLFKVGDEITLTVYRPVKNEKPQTITVKVVLEDRPETN